MDSLSPLNNWSALMVICAILYSQWRTGALNVTKFRTHGDKTAQKCDLCMQGGHRLVLHDACKSEKYKVLCHRIRHACRMSDKKNGPECLPDRLAGASKFMRPLLEQRYFRMSHSVLDPFASPQNGAKHYVQVCFHACWRAP